MKPLNLRTNGGKTLKTTPGQQCPKCRHVHMQHFFSPSPAIEKKFTESAFFHTKIKNLSWNRWIFEPMGAKHQKLLLGNNAPGPKLVKWLLAVEFSSQWGQNTKNYSWAKMPLASDFRPTCNISSALAPLSRKNSLSQHLFHTKIKNLSHETVEFTSQWWPKHQKLLLGNNASGKCRHAHMRHFFSPSPAIAK